LKSFFSLIQQLQVIPSLLFFLHKHLQCRMRERENVQDDIANSVCIIASELNFFLNPKRRDAYTFGRVREISTGIVCAEKRNTFYCCHYTCSSRNSKKSERKEKFNIKMISFSDVLFHRLMCLESVFAAVALFSSSVRSKWES
jgi:hypothetical protein